MKILIFFMLVLLSLSVFAQDEEELIELNYKTLARRPDLFERQKIKLSGIVTDIKEEVLKDNLTIVKFKLSKTSNVDQYFQVYFYKRYLTYNLPALDIIQNKILEVEGEFRMGYELSATKRLGDIYVNVDPYNQIRKAYLNDKKSSGYIIPDDNNKVVDATVSDMAIDFFENPFKATVKIFGFVQDVQYVDEKNGNIYYNILVRDFVSSESKISARYNIVVRYFLEIRGKQVADINMEDFFQKDQKVFLTGRYEFIEKTETTKLVGIVNMNYFNFKQEYKDHFVKQFQRFNKKSNVARVSNANTVARDQNEPVQSAEF